MVTKAGKGTLDRFRRFAERVSDEEFFAQMRVATAPRKPQCDELREHSMDAQTTNKRDKLKKNKTH